MRIGFFILFFCLLGSSVFGLGLELEDAIEIDLTNRKIKLASLALGDYKIDGDFVFNLDQSQDSLILNLEGKNIVLKDKTIAWVRVKLQKIANLILIRQFYIPGFSAKGDFDLEKNELALDLYGSWQENSKFLQGLVKVKVKLWGQIEDYIVSGHLVVTDGVYKGKEFSSFRVDILGKAPIFNITDSEVILKDGTVLEVAGRFDIRDFSNLMPGVEFKSQKVFIDQWQLFSEEESAGLKKNIDDKFDVVLGTSIQEQDQKEVPETEVRYNLQNDKFLKLKMENNQTILKFEKRTDF